MLCKSCGDEIKGEAVLGLCEKCWKRELEKEQNNNLNKNIEPVLKRNKLSKTLETFSSILIAILIIVGLCIYASTDSIFPTLILVIVGLIQVFFFFALAEIIQKLQNIEESIKKSK